MSEEAFPRSTLEEMEETEGISDNAEDSNDVSDEENDEEEDKYAEDVLVMPKRKKKDPSPVWECGALRVAEGCKCIFCGKVYRSEN